MDPRQNSMIDISEWEKSVNDFCQDWLLQNRIPSPQSEPIPTEPLYQNCLFNIPEVMFQPAPVEEMNRSSGKQPMLGSPTPFSHQLNDVCYGASTSNVVEPLHPSMYYEQEFEKHVKDSWAYISNLYSRKRKFIEPSNKLVVFGEEIDISEMPKPVCSCTGVPRVCRRWCGDGWISVCCTASVSMFPLPIRVGPGPLVRLQGRRMGYGSFARVVGELMLEGYDFDRPIDLKNHWVKLGSNKFIAYK